MKLQIIEKIENEYLFHEILTFDYTDIHKITKEIYSLCKKRLEYLRKHKEVVILFKLKY